ncbi:valacyclovir hydrolase-like [Oppia nitens]|uniref:valacyclovir hydrolase-like n=1 Tax=Oppia nitens TaxID=1686743 RepID=UPI0023DB6648|nr:valacyclovir hydrolase-like [Oppia nitens]
MFGNIIEIDGLNIHYEKIGNGSEVVLLLPGGLGTTRTDFTEQLDNFDPKVFTLIAWDPPGYGFSRPPERKWCPDIYQKDADLAAKLMQKLDITLYSLMGWSDGAKTALLMAIKYQSVIDKTIVWGACAYCKPENKRALMATKNIKVWNPTVRQCFERVYGNELQPMWEKLVDHYQINVDDICRNEAKNIRSPTFILHGDCDPLVDLEHPMYLMSQIPDARLHRFKEGSHNIHQEFAKQFNQLVTDFLLE